MRHKARQGKAEKYIGYQRFGEYMLNRGRNGVFFLMKYAHLDTEEKKS